MTRERMLKFIEENPGVKVTHLLFSDDEYIYQKSDGVVYDEDNCIYEDWKSEQHKGLRIRADEIWQNGWFMV